MTCCQWIEGEPSADDGCKCGAPVEPIDCALDASLTQRQGLRSIPYCAAHLARAYIPRALLWLKLLEFSEAANDFSLGPDPLEPRLTMFAWSGPVPCAPGEGRLARNRLGADARATQAHRNAEGPLLDHGKARGVRRQSTQ